MKSTRKSEITISNSQGISDVDKRKSKKYEIKELVNFESEQNILHIPVSESDEQAIKLFKTWTGTFKTYGLEISTGPVVDFRSIMFIKNKPGENYVPLIYLHNVNKMSFDWPSTKVSKGKEKGQFIEYCKESESRLVINNDYVLLRRFSSKDDHSKLIASPYFAQWLKGYNFIGIENHLNYIYRPLSVLEEDEVFGFAALLNSKLFDVYFRTFNGNINVSATELRNLPLPELLVIKKLGQRIKKYSHINQELINNALEQTFKIALN
jgi:adenine-specific DNA-methyltransferase